MPRMRSRIRRATPRRRWSSSRENGARGMRAEHTRPNARGARVSNGAEVRDAESDVVRGCRALLDDRRLWQRGAVAIATDAAERGRGDQAIAELRRAVVDARFGDAGALVALATLQRQRGSATADEDGADDTARAKTNLQRALAIDDASMPAMNQL